MSIETKSYVQTFEGLSFIDAEKTIEKLFVGLIRENTNLHVDLLDRSNTRVNNIFIDNYRYYTTMLGDIFAKLDEYENKLLNSTPVDSTLVYEGVVEANVRRHLPVNKFFTNFHPFLITVTCEKTISDAAIEENDDGSKYEVPCKYGVYTIVVSDKDLDIYEVDTITIDNVEGLEDFFVDVIYRYDGDRFPKYAFYRITDANVKNYLGKYDYRKIAEINKRNQYVHNQISAKVWGNVANLECFHRLNWRDHMRIPVSMDDHLKEFIGTGSRTYVPRGNLFE